MSIEFNGMRHMKPSHPGEMLREDFMPDYGLTVTTLSEKMEVSRQTVNELVLERRAVSPTMALRLSRLFGNKPEFWLRAQQAFDLWVAENENKEALKRIKPLRAA